MNRHYLWPTLVNCVAPAFFLCFAALSAWLGGENILSNRIMAVPSVYIGIALICVALFSIFRAHFNDSVANSIVWASICLSGFALILFFAFLHQAEGILCTAPICPNTDIISEHDPRLLTPLGTSHMSAWHVINPQQGVGLYLDQNFSTTLYYSTVTFTTLGYGDFQPLPRMRTIAGIEALIGYGYLGMVVGLLIELGKRR